MDKDGRLLLLLREWDLEELYAVLEENKINFERLQFLLPEDLKEIIPTLGVRIEFREKLLLWKKKTFNIDDSTITQASKVDTWLSSIPQSEPIYLPFDFISTFKSDAKGRAAVQFYAANNCLLEIHRTSLISHIIEQCLKLHIKLHCTDFANIVKQISILFPNENEDYYYVSRKNKRSPGGKLYDKFHNIINKKRRLEKHNSKLPTSTSSEDDEVDEEVLVSIKTSLKHNVADSMCQNLTVVSDSWKKTFVLRRKHFKISTNTQEFLKEWPAMKQSFGKYLIHYDFTAIFPDKAFDHVKWNNFKTEIFDYFDLNIKDLKSREDLAACKHLLKKNKGNEVDFMILRLLHSVILPTARFQDTANTSKKATRKFTIADGQLYKIISLCGNVDHCFVKCHEIEVKSFDEHFQSYLVGKSKRTKLYLYDIAKFSSPTIHSHTINNSKTYFRPKYL